ncbi:hypothetical protein [Leucobacter chromiiresistens]|uniref:hypothetical protein n=1 Tax=Leucobacter chromiiresistens TaxID=1079994 RepID=UPI00115FFE95|nr:hypothetical protein [Leucobacter chromiiresistens]
MENAQLLFFIYIAAGIVGFVLFWLLLWAVIRAGVLSALRAHSDEQREQADFDSCRPPLLREVE